MRARPEAYRKQEEMRSLCDRITFRRFLPIGDVFSFIFSFFFYSLASGKRMRDEKLSAVAEVIVTTRSVYLRERRGRAVALC